MVSWPFRQRERDNRRASSVPAMPTVEKTRLTSPDLLDILRWHIDRYDRLRASTSTRASILLSASSVVVTGMILLANYRLQLKEVHPIGPLDVALAVTLALTAALTLGSIQNCVNAIAARKTTRSLHDGEIPNRFLFNWGDTRRTVDGYSSFKEEVTSLSIESMIGNATAELWSDILQHADRHKYLRRGISLFRYGVSTFLIFAALTLAALR